MQNNPLQIIGGNILQEYESWLVADLFKGMEAFFEAAGDARRLGGDFLPDTFAQGSTGEMLRTFTEDFVPHDLLSSSGGMKETGEVSSSLTARSKGSPWVENPARQKMGSTSNFGGKYLDENNGSNEPLTPARPDPKVPGQTAYPFYETPKANQQSLHNQSLDKPSAYLNLLNKNEQAQTSNFQQNPTESLHQTPPGFAQNTSEHQPDFFENTKKNELPISANAAPQPHTSDLIPQTSDLIPHPSPSFQPLKNLKDFAQLFNPQQEMANPNIAPLQPPYWKEGTSQQNHQLNPIEPDTTPPPQPTAAMNISQNTAPTVYQNKNNNDETPPPPTPHFPQNEAPDMDDIMDELAQRLTKEYRRFYG